MHGERCDRLPQKQQTECKTTMVGNMHVTPHPLACVPLQPLGKPPFFPSFHPATDSHNTTNPQKNSQHPPHPAWRKKNKNKTFLPDQPKAPEHGVRLHPSAASPRKALSCVCSRTHTWRQMEHAPLCVRAADSQTLSQSATYPCPRPFPDPPPPFLAISSIARRLPASSVLQPQPQEL